MSSSLSRRGVLLSLVLLGCGVAPAPQNLVAVTAIEPGATCQSGGATLTSGLDSNGNGVLDAAEVQSTTQLCNGSVAPAPGAALLTTTLLAVGSAECPNGGTSLQTGLDDGDPSGTAHNGVLEAGEVDSTRALCNGAPAGALIKTTALPAGAAPCALGGTRLDTGLDDGDGGGTALNGVLESGEVDSTITLCNGAPAGSLIKTTTLAAGAAPCVLGGTRLETGLDDGDGGGIAGNGVLEAGEVDSTGELCNGPAAGALIKTTPLPAGAAPCLLGGSRLDTGLDDGDGGGIARNGVLESGEIDSTITVCNGQNAGGFDLTRPAGPAGTAHVNLNGGTRTSPTLAGPSGKGGTLTLGDGTTPGSYLVLDTGVAQTVHPAPALTVDLGTSAAIIASNTTLPEVGTSPPFEGQLYIDGSVTPARVVRYQSTPTPRYTAITGLRINAGATLTIGQATPQQVTIHGDLDVQGTLTTALTTSGSRASLRLSARNVNIGATGLINLSPATAVYTASPGDLDLAAAGTLLNAGTLSTAATAHPGDVAVAGGRLNLFAVSLFNTGTITSAAATSANAGGAGGNVTLQSYEALVNDGVITTSGGAGTSGGKAGNLTLNLGAPSHQLATQALTSTGALTAVGGSCANAGQSAGAGGVVSLVATRARLRHNAPIRASGGAPRLASGSVPAGDCASGAGGTIVFDASSDDSGWDASPMIDVSGALDASGPDGVRGGGAGGEVVVQVTRPQGGLARLLGYAAIDANAGFFGDVGSLGGTVRHHTQVTGGALVPEQLHLYPPINMVGGGSAGQGAAGGTLSFVHDVTGALGSLSASTAPALLLAGDVDARGGDGTLSRGAGGQLRFQGFGDVSLAGSLTLFGGGTVVVETTGELGVTAPILTPGSSQLGAAPATRGGQVSLLAGHVTLGAALSARGGDVTNNTRPGDGGQVLILSRQRSSTLTGAVSVAAGTGASGAALTFAAMDGIFSVDGVAR